MGNYASKIPIDKGGVPVDGLPAPLTAKAIYKATAVASSVITLTDNTTVLEVGAKVGGTNSGGIVIKWIRTTDTVASVISSTIVAPSSVANFDHLIPSGQIRRFVVPKETGGVNSVVGINIQEGLYNRVAWISATNVSAS